MKIDNPPAAHQELLEVPEGAAGTRATLNIMARLVRECRTDPLIRRTAANLVAELPEQSFYAEAEKLFFFVRDSIRYLQDTNNVEVLQNPRITLTERYGDCDDKATLLAALLESVGHPCRFVAVGYTKFDEFEHVYLETKIGARWVAAETTMPVPFGFAPIGAAIDGTVTAYMIGNI